MPEYTSVTYIGARAFLRACGVARYEQREGAINHGKTVSSVLSAGEPASPSHGDLLLALLGHASASMSLHLLNALGVHCLDV